MPKLIIVTLFIFISGCTFTPNFGEQLSLSDLKNTDTSEALIVIIKYGEHATSNYAGAHAVVAINGKDTADILEKTYIRLSIPEGENIVSVYTPFGQRPVSSMMLFGEYEIKKTFRGGETYFLHYEIDADPMRQYLGAYGYENVQTFNDIYFSEINADKALKLMSKSRFLVDITK